MQRSGDENVSIVHVRVFIPAPFESVDLLTQNQSKRSTNESARAHTHTHTGDAHREIGVVHSCRVQSTTGTREEGGEKMVEGSGS